MRLRPLFALLLGLQLAPVLAQETPSPQAPAVAPFSNPLNENEKEQAELYGDELWARQPDLCCATRKVEPLQRALGEVDAWVTGVRRDQAPTRANAKKVEWDEKFGLVKANPLADWTLKEVWAYIHEHDVPYNPLHDRNFPSIGCTHCTRPVMPGEDPRAGRWAGQDKVECGLHPADAK